MMQMFFELHKIFKIYFNQKIIYLSSLQPIIEQASHSWTIIMQALHVKQQLDNYYTVL